MWAAVKDGGAVNLSQARELVVHKVLGEYAVRAVLDSDRVVTLKVFDTKEKADDYIGSFIEDISSDISPLIMQLREFLTMRMHMWTRGKHLYRKGFIEWLKDKDKMQEVIEELEALEKRGMLKIFRAGLALDASKIVRIGIERNRDENFPYSVAALTANNEVNILEWFATK